MAPILGPARLLPWSSSCVACVKFASPVKGLINPGGGPTYPPLPPAPLYPSSFPPLVVGESPDHVLELSLVSARSCGCVGLEEGGIPVFLGLGRKSSYYRDIIRISRYIAQIIHKNVEVIVPDIIGIISVY
ncbi:hypothetical protein ACE6H2_006016 [Prunus campanulata]